MWPIIWKFLNNFLYDYDYDYDYDHAYCETFNFLYIASFTDYEYIIRDLDGLLLLVDHIF